MRARFPFLALALSASLFIFFLSLFVSSAKEEDAQVTGELSEATIEKRTPSEEPQEKPTNFFEKIFSKILHSQSESDILNILEEALRKCDDYDAYEALASGVKNLIIGNPDFKYIGALNYGMAMIRLEELSYLLRQNDIDSGRLYMSVNSVYRDEALECLDAALNDVESKETILDISFLKALVFKDSFQPQKVDSILDEMAGRIASYNDDKAVNKERLMRMVDKFNKKGLPDYALRLRTLYASKVDVSTAQGVFEDIKSEADRFFAQGNIKPAQGLYEQYIANGQAYFAPEAMAAKVMELAEKYFASAKYMEARRYYELYKASPAESQVLDYCDYRIALSVYYEKDYPLAISLLTNFISVYQNSVWFDKAFEVLSKLYYVNFSTSDAILKLQKLVDEYYRKNVGDYAHLLIASLYYGDGAYDSALKSLKAITPDSIYYFPSDTLLSDIKNIKESRRKPSFSFWSIDNYRVWESDAAITATLNCFPADDETAWLKVGVKTKEEKLGFLYTSSGFPKLNVKAKSKIRFTLDDLYDIDKFSEYIQDKEDLSRPPKKLDEGTERDLLSLKWAADGGRFIDENQTPTKVWEAPSEPGSYKVSVTVDDIGLVRLADKGSREDSEKELSVLVSVQN